MWKLVALPFLLLVCLACGDDGPTLPSVWTAEFQFKLTVVSPLGTPTSAEIVFEVSDQVVTATIPIGEATTIHTQDGVTGDNFCIRVYQVRPNNGVPPAFASLPYCASREKNKAIYILEMEDRL